jgi:hypothetical protein
MGAAAWKRMFNTTILIALTAGICISLVQFWLNTDGSAVSTQPHDVPIAVVGSPLAVRQLSPELERGDAFKVEEASNEAAALRMVNDRTSDGIVNLNTHVVQTARAASVPAAGILQGLFSTQPGFRVYEIKPLPAHDANGLGFLFLALAFGLGGLPAGLALAFLGGGRRPASMADAGRYALLVAAYSGVLALTVAAVSVPLLGYNGSQFWTVWGWGTLLTAAAMSTGLGLGALIGLAAIPVGLLVILFFGIASSPTPTQPWNFASGPYRVLGPYDPVGAAVDGTRNTMFFGGATITRDLLVLLGWIVIPLLVLLAFGWRAQRTGPTGTEPTSQTAALPLEQQTERSAVLQEAG